VRQLRYLQDPAARAAERLAFVDAGLRLLAAREDLQLSVSEVVRAAGRNNTSFYELFGSLEGLQQAMLQEVIRRSAARIGKQVAVARTTEGKVRAWTAALLSHTSRPQAAANALPFVLTRHQLMRSSPAGADMTLPIRSVLHDALRAGGVTDPEGVAEAAYELVTGTQARWLALGTTPTRRQRRSLEEFVLRLLGPPAAEGTTGPETA
jgi:AcrR family transcriptional regulator